MTPVPEPTERQTEHLIDRLTADFSRAKTFPEPFGILWAAWTLGVFVLACLTVVSVHYLPAYLHLPTDLGRFWFWFENVLWLSIGLLSATVAYRSMTPGQASSRLANITYGLLCVLLFSILLRWRPSAFAGELDGEMHWLQGPCGFFIFLVGILCSVGLFMVIRWRGAPVRLRWTSAWAAMSMGAIGATLMHLVCLHESSMHLILWHFAPAVLLSLISFGFGRFLLRW